MTVPCNGNKVSSFNVDGFHSWHLFEIRINKYLCRSLQINSNQFLSIPMRTYVHLCRAMQIKPPLIPHISAKICIDRCWSELIKIDLHWSASIFIDLYWSLLINTGNLLYRKFFIDPYRSVYLCISFIFFTST